MADNIRFIEKLKLLKVTMPGVLWCGDMNDRFDAEHLKIQMQRHFKNVTYILIEDPELENFQFILRPDGTLSVSTNLMNDIEAKTGILEFNSKFIKNSHLN